MPLLPGCLFGRDPVQNVKRRISGSQIFTGSLMTSWSAFFRAKGTSFQEPSGSSFSTYTGVLVR